MLKLGEQELEWLTVGAAVFGGGGGGDPLLGSMMARRAVREAGPVPLVQLESLDDADVILPSAMVGAPTVMTEKFPAGDEGLRLQAAVESIMDTKVAALSSGELGGINGVLPVAWAAWAGLPIVDCDLMGRAFPELQMTTAALAGVSINPVVLTDERTNTVTFTAVDATWAEKLVRNVVTTMGGQASMCLYPMTVAEAKRATVRNSVPRAIEVGRIMTEATDHPAEALCDHLDGFALLDGKVVDVDRQTTAGFARGSAVIEGIGASSGRLVRMEFQNENIIVIEDGQVLASAPDIITAVDIHTARPIVTELLRYGQRVSLLALPCDDAWRTPEGLAVVGPRAFAYDVDYVPVEELHG